MCVCVGVVGGAVVNGACLEAEKDGGGTQQADKRGEERRMEGMNGRVGERTERNE